MGHEFLVFLSWVQRTPLSAAIRRSDWDVMAFESVHLLGLALLGGAATILALAALKRGGLRGLALMPLVRQLRPLILTGLTLMVFSGTLIVISMPYKYYLNAAFRVKMLLLLAAIAVTVWLARTAVGPRAGSARALALLAWLLWLGVGFSGRLIGFL
jgi:hypothetical protein